VFRYRLYSTDGDDLGETAYSVPIHVGDLIHYNGPAPYLVIDTLVFTGHESPLTGLLQVSAPVQVE
jgi:hypothetical protein